MPARVYLCKSSEIGALKKLLEYDPYLDKSLSEDELKKIIASIDEERSKAEQGFGFIFG